MISEAEWASIRELAIKLASQVANQTGNFVTGKVIKRDEKNKLVWLRELGDQPIPVVGFRYDVKYYDEGSSGAVNVKTTTAVPQTPQLGDYVFVALEMGAQSLPRCLGVILGTNWIITENT